MYSCEACQEGCQGNCQQEQGHHGAGTPRLAAIGALRCACVCGCLHVFSVRLHVSSRPPAQLSVADKLALPRMKVIRVAPAPEATPPRVRVGATNSLLVVYLAPCICLDGRAHSNPYANERVPTYLISTPFLESCLQAIIRVRPFDLARNPALQV